MSLTREQKTAQAASVRESFDNASATVLVDFRGVNVELITDLRSRFREAGVEYRVVKNNVVLKALEGSDLADNDVTRRIATIKCGALLHRIGHSGQ